MSGISKGLEKVEVGLRWDPAPIGSPAVDLDIVAAVFASDAPRGEPVQLVHVGRRSPDGTITLSRDSRTGQGFGYDEVMVLELHRMPRDRVRAVVGAVVQQRPERREFGQVSGPGFRVREGHEVLSEGGFAEVADATAATVAEFERDDDGVWHFRAVLRGHDADPNGYAELIGRD